MEFAGAGCAFKASGLSGERSGAADPVQQVPDESFGELLGEGQVGDEEPVVAGAPELVDDEFGVDVLA